MLSKEQFDTFKKLREVQMIWICQIPATVEEIGERYFSVACYI